MDSISQKTASQKTVIVIPVYNEEKNIGQVIPQVKNYSDNIIVIDDGSEDETYLVAKESAQNIQNIIVLKHKINLGKGAALKTGCEAAIRLGAGVIIVMDGDGQHSPTDIPRLAEKLKKENLDIVFGVRQLNKKTPILRSLGNKILTKTINLLSDMSLNDSISGFRAFTAKAYQKIYWQSQDYSVEAEMIINIGKHKLKYSQVPIKTIYKDSYKGLDILIGIKILLNLFKFRFL